MKEYNEIASCTAYPGHFSHPTELAKNGCILSKVTCCLLMVVKVLIKQFII